MTRISWSQRAAHGSWGLWKNDVEVWETKPMRYSSERRLFIRPSSVPSSRILDKQTNIAILCCPYLLCGDVPWSFSSWTHVVGPKDRKHGNMQGTAAGTIAPTCRPGKTRLCHGILNPHAATFFASRSVRRFTGDVM
jgi:hypothetical protein